LGELRRLPERGVKTIGVVLETIFNENPALAAEKSPLRKKEQACGVDNVCKPIPRWRSVLSNFSAAESLSVFVLRTPTAELSRSPFLRNPTRPRSTIVPPDATWRNFFLRVQLRTILPVAVASEVSWRVLFQIVCRWIPARRRGSERRNDGGKSEHPRLLILRPPLGVSQKTAGEFRINRSIPNKSESKVAAEFPGARSLHQHSLQATMPSVTELPCWIAGIFNRN